MLDSYEELMLPLFLRLGGSDEHLHMDEMLERESIDVPSSSITVEETSNVLAAAHRAATRCLEEQVLAHIYAQTPRFFEGLIIDLLLAMGYANRKRDLARQIGRSHDGGVDGIFARPFGPRRDFAASQTVEAQQHHFIFTSAGLHRHFGNQEGHQRNFLHHGKLFGICKVRHTKRFPPRAVD